MNQDEYWKTKEGVMIKLSDMEDSHLQNSINMAEKRRAGLLATIDLVNGTIVKLNAEKLRRKDAQAAARIAAKAKLAIGTAIRKRNEPKAGRKFRIA